MKRIRTYLNSRGGSRDEQKAENSNSDTRRQPQHPSASSPNVNIRFSSPQNVATAKTQTSVSPRRDNNLSRSQDLAAAENQVQQESVSPHPAPPLLRIDADPVIDITNGSPRSKIRKPAPRYSGGSILVPFPPSEFISSPSAASEQQIDSDATNTPMVPRLRTHGRSKSVRIALPHDAVLGTFARSRSLSSPTGGTVSKFGFGAHNHCSWSSNSSAFAARPTLPPLPENKDDDEVNHDSTDEHMLSSAFSDSEVEDEDDEDDCKTSTADSQSVHSIRLDDLSATDIASDLDYNETSALFGSHPVSWVSAAQNNFCRPLNIRRRENKVAPIQSPGEDYADRRRHSHTSEKDVAGVRRGNTLGSYLRTPEPSLDSESLTATLDDKTHIARSANQHLHKLRNSRLSHLDVQDAVSLSDNRNYTPLLPGMSSVISLEGTEYLVVLESLLEGWAEPDPSSRRAPGDVRVRVVGGGPRWRERLYPDAYVVMFIEGEECLVRVIRELGAGDLSQSQPKSPKGNDISARGNPTGLLKPDSDWSPNDTTTMRDPSNPYPSNPYHMSWIPGMHITVTLAGDIFLVVQIECLGLLPFSNEQMDIDFDEDISAVQIAGVNAEWWSLPANGNHAVLVLKKGKRRLEYLVRVVRRLTAITESVRESRRDLGDKYEAHSPRHATHNYPPLPPTRAAAVPPRSQVLPKKSDVLHLAQGYRFLVVPSDGSGSLRFELLFEDRRDEWHAEYVQAVSEANWVVAGGQSGVDATWVFKMDGKSALPDSEMDIEQLRAQRRNSRAHGGASGGSGSVASAELPHHFIFKRDPWNDGWVFTPALGTPSIELPPNVVSQLPDNLNEMLLNQGFSFLDDVGLKIFTSKLLLKKRHDGDILVFRLAPASHEQVKEAIRRIRVIRDERESRSELVDGRWCNIAGPDGRIDEEELIRVGPSSSSGSVIAAKLAAPEHVSEVPKEQLREKPDREQASFRALRYGRRGELIFTPWDSNGLHSTPSHNESNNSAKRSSSASSSLDSKLFTGEFLVYSKSDSETAAVESKSYIFYPADHDDIQQDLRDASSSGLSNTTSLRKYTYKMNLKDDAWMFVPLDSDIGELSSNVNGAASGNLFRAFMDGAGKITFNQIPTRSSTKHRIRSSIGSIPGLGLLSPSHTQKTSVESVKSESHITKRRYYRPLSEHLMPMKNFKFPRLSPTIATLKSPVTEQNRATSISSNSTTTTDLAGPSYPK